MKHEIAKRLMEFFDSSYVSVHDDSLAHAGHRGTSKVGDTHFNVVVVSSRFEGVSSVKRHQMVYSLFKDLFAEGLHALAITAKTTEEWALRG